MNDIKYSLIAKDMQYYKSLINYSKLHNIMKQRNLAMYSELYEQQSRINVPPS